MTAHRARLAGLILALLVGACSLPTFNPPKLKTMVDPGTPAAAAIAARLASRQVALN